jgi:zinc protease
MYDVEIAKQYLPEVMQLEADRMMNMQPPAADFLRERKVIIEERRMRTDNDPQALLFEQMNAMLFRNHPYRRPAIGWLSEMRELSEKDVLDFHHRYYYPSNAVLLLVGDITAAEAKPMVEKYYGGLPAVPVPARHWNEEPPQIGARRIVMHNDNVRQLAWSRIYMAPSMVYGDKREAMPLYLFAQVLAGGPSSRMYQALVVKRKLASDVSVEYDGLRIGPGEFSVSAVPMPGVSMAQLEAAIDGELQNALATPVAPDELARAKTLFKADTIYARDGLVNVTYILAILRALGLPPSFFTDWPRMIDAVTQAQIEAAAHDVIKPQQSVTGILLPKGAAK